jgi:hypothetical protein
MSRSHTLEKLAAAGTAVIALLAIPATAPTAAAGGFHGGMASFGAFHTPPPRSSIPARPPFFAAPRPEHGFHNDADFDDFGGSHHGWGRRFAGAGATVWPGWWGGGYYGYDSGAYAPVYVNASSPPQPATTVSAEPPETPICPEIVHWSVKLGHETRTRLCS